MFLNVSAESASLQEILPQMMELDKYYVVKILGLDDDGNPVISAEIVWYCIDKVPGQVKPVKVFRFCTAPKTLRFSQLPGAQFYGPIEVGYTEIDHVAPVDSGESALSKALNKRVERQTETKPESIPCSTCPACGKPNATLEGPTVPDGVPSYWCRNCDEVWEAKL